MFAWLVSLVHNYLGWANAWHPAPEPYLLGGTILGAFSGGVYFALISKRHLKYQKPSVGATLFGMLVGAMLGVFAGAAVADAGPYVLGSGIVLVLLYGSVSLVIDLFSQNGFVRAMTVNIKVTELFRVGGMWLARVFRRLTGLQSSEDRLLPLHRKAKLVERRLKELVVQRDNLKSECQRVRQWCRQANDLRSSLTNGTAAAQICDEATLKLHRQANDLQSRSEGLDTIVDKLRQGTREVEQLTTLACVHHHAHTPGAGKNDARIARMAQVALEALQRACAEADVLLATTIAESDTELSLAFNHMSESVQRSATLEAQSIAIRLDGLSASAQPARMKA